MNPHIERLQAKNRREWLALHEHDVTASRGVAAVLGVHPDATPLQEWQEKTHRKTSDADLDNNSMQRGRELEDLIFTQTLRRLPTCELEHNDATAPLYWRDTFLRIGCTPDVVAMHPERGRGVVELKSVEPGEYRKHWIDDYPPPHIVLQTQVQARLVGAQWAAVGVLRVGHAFEFDLIEIPLLSDNLWQRITGTVQNFWHLVETDTPPPPDFTRDGKAIAELVGASDGSAIDLSTDNELVDALHKREEHKKLMGMLDEDLEAIDAMIRFKAGAHEVVTAGDFRLTLKTQQVAGYTVKPRTQRPIRQKRIRNEELSHK